MPILGDLRPQLYDFLYVGFAVPLQSWKVKLERNSAKHRQ